jgi:DNA-binding Lrp family transcriptional regulator
VRKVPILPECEMMLMRKAFVMITTDLGTETVQSELRKVEGIVGVYQVFGIYDLVVVVEAESEEELKYIIFSRIRSLKYLRSTLTLNVVS